ncbi:hypothetical protein RJT34_07562 [Clitoria ternatea]|uniref:Uncharacterized protein n=1 Tax=Clitoria ternatea TaxID=43366 RepID=A0AAN9PTL0_CLITE
MRLLIPLALGIYVMITHENQELLRPSLSLLSQLLMELQCEIYIYPTLPDSSRLLQSSSREQDRKTRARLL